MEHKSTRSDKFREWLSKQGMDVHSDAASLLVDLERHARICAHVYQLMGNVPSHDMTGIVRASKALRSLYENTGE